MMRLIICVLVVFAVLFFLIISFIFMTPREKNLRLLEAQEVMIRNREEK